MKVRLGLMAIGLCFSFSAWGQGTGSVSYVQLDDSDIALGGLVGTAGYRFELSDNFALVPEVRVGTGVRKDTFEDFTFKLKRFIAGAVRAELSLADKAYFFGGVSYGHYKFNARAFEIISVNDSINEFGFGGGIGFRIDKDVFIELGYEDIDDVGVISVGTRFYF